jgi:hypothetical protein
VNRTARLWVFMSVCSGSLTGCFPRPCIQWVERCEVLDIHNATNRPIIVTERGDPATRQRIAPGERGRQWVIVRASAPPEQVRISREGSFRSEKISVDPRWDDNEAASRNPRRFRVDAVGPTWVVVEETAPALGK